MCTKGCLMFDYGNDIFKKRFFINIQLSKKDMNISTAKRQKAIDDIVSTQNAMKEICYGNRDIIKDVYISTDYVQSIFPPVPKLAFLDSDKFRPVLKTDISLTEALEFIAFGVVPTDEYGKKVSKFRPFYKNDLGSEEGKSQMVQMHVAAEILEALFERGLEFRKKHETEYSEHIGFEPKVSITDGDSAVILTDTKTCEAYDDVTVNFEDLKKAFAASCDPSQNSYRLDIIDRKLYVFKNDQKHLVKDFRRHNKEGVHISQAEVVLKYFIDHPGRDITTDEIGKYKGAGVSLYGSPNSNFRNMFEHFFRHGIPKYNLNNAIINNFFEYFKSKVVKYKGVIHDFPDYLLD